MTIDTSSWGWPQWTVFIWLAFAVLVTASKHGQPKENYNGFMAIIMAGINFLVLSAGGFFQ